ncbi:MAG TPA: polysaccharide biosynthesis tyrosine autokinase [Allocoleopsis sp.]
MKAGHSSQALPLANAARLNDSDEGGLDLGQLLGAVRRRSLLVLGVAAVVASAAVLKARSDTPVYQASFDILTQPVTAESEVVSSVPQTLTSSQEKKASATVDDTTIKVLKSPDVLSPAIEKLKARHPDASYEAVSSLGITTSGNILTVTYQNPNPALVKDVLDVVAQAYLKYSLDERRTDIRQGLKFVEEQLPQLRSRVESQQDRLQKIRQQNNLVDPEKTGAQLSNQISAFEQQRIDNQLQLQQAKSLYADLQQELAQPSVESAASTPLSDNARYQKILDRLQDIDGQIAKESARFLDTSPNMESLRQQRQKLLPLLRREGQRVEDEMTSRIRTLEVRDRILTQTLANLNFQVKQLSLINRDYSDIQRELQIATENLNQFLAKREALRIDLAQREIPWRLLAPIGKPQPSAASAKKNAILGTVVGLLLGLGVALIVDKLSNLVYTTKEVKEITKLPLLGVIPLAKEPRKFAPTVNVAALVQQANLNFGLGKSERTQQQNATFFFEVFRSLYTNIRLLGSDTQICSFVISSAAQEDGKSTIAANLAQAAAAMGQRVLLVDTNLRHPSVDRQVELMNIQGLTDVISTDLDFNEVIQRSPLEDNLFVLTAGPIPPDPIRLLASQKMQDLMEKLQAAFDLVIYDAPSLLGFADAYLLATHTNGIVLVTGLGKLKRSVLEQALEELKVSGTSLLGVVANRAKDYKPNAYSYYQRSFTQESSLPKLGSPLAKAMGKVYFLEPSRKERE